MSIRPSYIFIPFIGSRVHKNLKSICCSFLPLTIVNPFVEYLARTKEESSAELIYQNWYYYCYFEGWNLLRCKLPASAKFDSFCFNSTFHWIRATYKQLCRHFSCAFRNRVFYSPSPSLVHVIWVSSYWNWKFYLHEIIFPVIQKTF